MKTSKIKTVRNIGRDVLPFQATPHKHLGTRCLSSHKLAEHRL